MSMTITAGKHCTMEVGATDEMPASINKLISLIQNHNHMTPRVAKELVIQAGIKAEDVEQWADYEHPPSACYGRYLVYHGGFFEIMAMSWAPGDFSAIHDHGTAMWGAVKCFGHAEHAVFELENDALRTKCRHDVRPNEVNAVTHDLIHQMGNPGNKPFQTLHLYGTYDRCESITGGARLYDLLEPCVQIIDGGTFYGLTSEEIIERREGVMADYATRLRHHVEYLKRLHRGIPSSEEPEPLLEKARELTWEITRMLEPSVFQAEMSALLDKTGTIKDRDQWRVLWHEAHVAADCLASIQRARN